MATIIVPPVLIELAGPALLAVVIGASLAALTWKPRRGENDPIRTVAVIEIVVVGFGVTVWQAISGNLGPAAVALVVALIGLVPAVRLITAAQDGDSDDGREHDLDVSLTRPSIGSPERIQIEKPVQAYGRQRPQRTPDGSTSSAPIAGLAWSSSVETRPLEG